MKRMKRLLSFALALVMICALGVTAMADEPVTYTITINNTAPDHVYQAYQIFAGTLSKDGTVLSDIVWGSGVDDAALLTALKASTTYSTLFANAASAEDVADILAANPGIAKDFAVIAGANLKTVTSGTLAEVKAEGVTTGYTISGLAAGYYLVKDAAGTLDDENDAYTGFILEVVDNVAVTPKSTIPTVDKQVQDDDTPSLTDEWGAVADYDIGDKVPFRLTAYIPVDFLSQYTSYSITFHDTLSTGLTLNDDSMTMGINGAAGAAVTPVTPGTGTESFNLTVEFDAAALAAAISGAVSGYVEVEVNYTATLNGNAVVYYYANTNSVYLTYSNNPNGAGEGKTEEKKVIVYTYEFEIFKYTKGDEVAEPVADGDYYAEDGKSYVKQPLADATFKLYRAYNSETKVYSGEVKFTLVNGVYRVDPDGSDILTSDADGKISIEGLDEGDYFLVETQAPDGYNKLDGHTDVKINAASNDYKATYVEVLNKSGAELPSTGGVGTTMFYVIGAALIGFAVIMLIVKKRKNEAAN